MANVRLLYHTLRPLRWRQIWYRAWHPVIKRVSRPKTRPPAVPPRTQRTDHAPQVWPVPHAFDPEALEFVFVDRRHRFSRRIDWFHGAEGPLWAFNLQYFEWLYDETLSVSARLVTVRAFCRDTRPGRSMHGYTSSLRMMAWIWMDLAHGGLDDHMRQRLYQDADWLRRFPEYHLDGNHLFENGIALCGAGVYFDDPNLRNAGWEILEACLREQIGADGGHCEGSPMYHSLLLWRLLQLIDIMQAYERASRMQDEVSAAAGKMLGWLKAVTFSDGSWPQVNDATVGVAPAPKVLFGAAHALGITTPVIPLSDSGYRMIRSGRYELFIDTGGIAPAWQPGHAHADTGNFCLHIDGKPVIVDTGCSSYEDAEIRSWQRGTPAHNALSIDRKDSSELWSRFRVGKRCVVRSLDEGADFIHIYYRDAAGHDISRKFIWDDHGFTILDRAPANALNICAALHFAQGVNAMEIGVPGVLAIEYEYVEKVVITRREIARGFNISFPAACLLLQPDKNHMLVRFRIDDK